MNTLQHTQIKEKIIQDLESMYKEIELLKEYTQPIAPDCSLGRLTRQEMIQEQKVYVHALHEAEIRVNKLTYALQKVTTKGYGICAECEEDILFERLMILPESTYCVHCKEELGL